MKDGRDRSIILYVDDRPLADVVAYPPTDPSQPPLMFPLRRTEASRAVWTEILGKPRWGSRKTKISIGIQDRYAIPSLPNATVNLWVLPRGWFSFWLFLFGLLLTIFFLLARKSDLLRDSNGTPPMGARRTFSLARTQAAWWFFLILASYLFIGVVTGDFSTSITGTVLVLLGISAGTTMGGGHRFQQVHAGRAGERGGGGPEPEGRATATRRRHGDNEDRPEDNAGRSDHDPRPGQSDGGSGGEAFPTPEAAEHLRAD
jgi:hypothetical protein